MPRQGVSRSYIVNGFIGIEVAVNTK